MHKARRLVMTYATTSSCETYIIDQPKHVQQQEPQRLGKQSNNPLATLHTFSFIACVAMVQEF